MLLDWQLSVQPANKFHNNDYVLISVTITVVHHTNHIVVGDMSKNKLQYP